MFIKPSKKWRNPEGDQTIMVPYTYYRLCESYREADGKWLEEKREAQERTDRLAEGARRKAEEAKAVKVSTLARLCAALNCQPGDLLEYRPKGE